jgi:hypothetical protein
MVDENLNFDNEEDLYQLPQETPELPNEEQLINDESRGSGLPASTPQTGQVPSRKTRSLRGLSKFKKTGRIDQTTTTPLNLDSFSVNIPIDNREIITQQEVQPRSGATGSRGLAGPQGSRGLRGVQGDMGLVTLVLKEQLVILETLALKEQQEILGTLVLKELPAKVLLLLDPKDTYWKYWEHWTPRKYWKHWPSRNNRKHW